jgi:1,4-alpha-glucan branching enzyme
MSLKKQYLKNKPVCKVTFTLLKDMAGPAKDVALVGDFNDWTPEATPMKRKKDGSFEATVSLEAGHGYQFRYLLDGSAWENDDNADAYVRTPYGDADNSIVSV